MRLLRAFAPLVGLLAALAGMPAQAADSQVQASGFQRWEVVPTPGTWSPYSVAVKNHSDRDFNGYVTLIPVRGAQSLGQPAPAVEGWPNYRQRVTVPRGTEKLVTVYTSEAPNGYRLEIQDAGGALLSSSDVRRPVGTAGLAFGLLTDQRGGDDILNRLYGASQRAVLVTQFAPQAFPTNAVYLSGLQGIVIDNFDSESLSQAQRQALREFVGFGGSLIIAGGPKWRRTVLPLPAELTPLRPAETVVVSLSALADLAGAHTDVHASVMAGELKSGRPVLWSGNDPPLIVEGGFGAGRIVEMTFDPLDDPLISTSNPPLAALAWGQAVARTLGPQGTNLSYGKGPVGTAQATSRASQPPAAVNLSAPEGSSVAVYAGGPSVAPPYGKQGSVVEDQIYQMLRDTPAASAPPLALLGGLLVAYVLLVGPLNYLVFNAARRRELLWVSVPVTAIFFTVSAYGLGIGIRGQDFYDNEVQIQRLAPGGAVSIASYHGIFSPYKGDYTVKMAPNTLTTTIIGTNNYYAYLGSSTTDTVTIDNRSQVDIHNVGVWQMRTVQTLTAGHSQAAVDATLRQQDGKFKGSLANRGAVALRDIRLVAGDGRQSTLSPGLAPGAVANVDADIGFLPNTGLPVNQRAPNGVSNPSETINSDRRQATLDVAAMSVQGRPGEYFLVALVDPKPVIDIVNAKPNHSAIAALIIPIRLDSVDVLPQSMQPRLISSTSQLPNFLDIYDLDIPVGISGQLQMSYGLPYLTSQGKTLQSRGTIEVYDFSTTSWRQLDVPQAPAVTSAKTQLKSGETSAGLVRVRVKEMTPSNGQLSLQKLASP